MYVRFFFFNDTATTEIYTLSLHDALPIYPSSPHAMARLVELRDRFDLAFGNDADADRHGIVTPSLGLLNPNQDRKSTRLNSSHANISYAVFCLKKKKNTTYDLVLSPLHKL